MRRWLACVAVVVTLGALNACVRPRPSFEEVTITLTAASAPAGTGIIVEVDAIPTAAGHAVFDLYPFEHVTVAPYVHVIRVQPGALLHASIKVHATEPDQIVGCSVLRNGALIPGSEGAGTFSKPAVCISPQA